MDKSVNNKKVSIKIRQLRTDLELKQGEVAEAAGYAPSAISKIENSEKQITVEDLYALSNALGVNANQLLHDSNLAKADKYDIEFKKHDPQTKAAVLELLKKLNIS